MIHRFQWVALVFLVTAGFLVSAAELPAEILIWPDGAPGSEGKSAPEVVKTSGNGERQVSSIHKPSITPFLPAKEKATGAAVLVIPGGGHRVLCVDHEGCNIALWLAEHGIAAFVLKHRLAREEGSTYTIQGHALADTERAMRLIRSRAQEFGIDPVRLGAMGFSAEGELVAQACIRTTAFDAALSGAECWRGSGSREAPARIVAATPAVWISIHDDLAEA